MPNRTAQDMQDHGVRRISRALGHLPGFHVFTEASEFAIPSHMPPPGQLLMTIDGYDYLITIEFQDPR